MNPMPNTLPTLQWVEFIEDEGEDHEKIVEFLGELKIV